MDWEQASFPEDTFWPAHNKMLKAFEGEGVAFNDILIDRSFPEDNAPTRKPRTGLMGKYMDGSYDLANCYVIGDRLTDVELAKNLGCKAIWLSDQPDELLAEKGLSEVCVLKTTNWDEVYAEVAKTDRTATVKRTTKETDIDVWLDLDGTGKTNISTGLGFFDHMLDQIGRHSGIDLKVIVKGDLEVDEHHTIEDTAIALGEAFLKALGNKRGIERYGFCLAHGRLLVQVALDFGGRHGWCGMPNSPANGLATCPPRCSFTFSNRSAMRRNATSTSRPKDRTSTTKLKESSRHWQNP
jgi:imidazoleglycerol-phosphate dehydratase / histidinol-phosphatase